MENVSLEMMADFFDARSEIYEERHLADLEGGVESKRSLAIPLDSNTRNLLDLGIGTGLELERIYSRFPDLEITGLDISSKMLSQLKKKYPNKNLTLLQRSYLDYDFGAKKYDAVISSMTMHHYIPAIKVALYQKICNSLKSGGVYIENDYMLSEIDTPDASVMEKKFFNDYERIKNEQNLLPNADYHFDTPCTIMHQIEMLYIAGFSDVRLVWQRINNVTLAAYTQK